MILSLTKVRGPIHLYKTITHFDFWTAGLKHSLFLVFFIRSLPNPIFWIIPCLESSHNFIHQSIPSSYSSVTEKKIFVNFHLVCKKYPYILQNSLPLGTGKTTFVKSLGWSNEVNFLCWSKFRPEFFSTLISQVW